jgi:predicted lipid-binding transport protein (Tim44 family)
MPKNTWLRIMFVFASFLLFLFYVLGTDSFARVGGGMSSGSRGSRSFSSPGRSAPSGPMGPYQSSGTPFGGGGLLRNMLGGMAGGFLGSMLFRGLGFGGYGGGVSLFEVILIAFILYGVYRFVKKRREQAEGTSYYQSSSSGEPSYRQAYEPPSSGGQETDALAGLRYIRQMDSSFDEAGFADTCMDIFFKIQGAWASRDMSPVRNLLTDEMYRTIQSDADKLKLERRINKLDNIAVRSTDLIEAWQESGRDYITVRFYANLLDYTVDEATGQVMTGSKTDPVKFEEYWTFTRPLGNNPWQLSAIIQPQ